RVPRQSLETGGATAPNEPELGLRIERKKKHQLNASQLLIAVIPNSGYERREALQMNLKPSLRTAL
ncbi:MAG: hypothetical protein AAFQ98_19560, partial [Bacteroidota bacterium]